MAISGGSFAGSACVAGCRENVPSGVAQASPRPHDDGVQGLEQGRELNNPAWEFPTAEGIATALGTDIVRD
jgi:hypothetical protein